MSANMQGRESASDRMARLRVERDRISAELKAVEDGTLLWIEAQGRAVMVGEFADEFALSPQAANNRLARLVALGLLTREPVMVRGGGRSYVYKAQDGRGA